MTAICLCDSREELSSAASDLSCFCDIISARQLIRRFRYTCCVSDTICNFFWINAREAKASRFCHVVWPCNLFWSKESKEEQKEEEEEEEVPLWMKAPFPKNVFTAVLSFLFHNHSPFLYLYSCCSPVSAFWFRFLSFAQLNYVAKSIRTRPHTFVYLCSGSVLPDWGPFSHIKCLHSTFLHLSNHAS